MGRLGQKATREQTRVHNSRLVLKTIYDREQISRADIARETRLTRTTISDVVAELMEQGLVEEVGYGPPTGGKPPILVSVIDDSRHLIGLDLASDEFCGAVVNLRGQIRYQERLPLDGGDGQAALELVYTLIDRLVAVADRPLLGIGIGTPGLMDPIDGVVRRRGQPRLAGPAAAPAVGRALPPAGVRGQRLPDCGPGRVHLRRRPGQRQSGGDQGRARHRRRDCAEWAALLRRYVRRRRDRPRDGGGQRPALPVRQPGLPGDGGQRPGDR